MRKKILIVLLIPLLSVVSTADTSAATITLRDHANVVSALVSLSDVATVSGTEPPEELEALRSIVICSAPLPAETHILGLTTIASALRASSADLSRLKLMGPTQVVVRREHALVSVDELSSAFSEHVSRKTGWPQDSFMVRAPKNLRAIPVPVGSRAIIVDTFPDENYWGSVLAHFQVLVDGKLHCKLSPRFVIEHYVEALVAVRKLSRGQPVKASDVEITKVEQSLIEEESFTGKEQAEGLVAIRTIRPGTVLSAELLGPPAIVQRGQNASVILEGNGFNIVTRGRVLEHGCADELVRVRLPSRKIVRARVLNSKTLQLPRQGEKHEESQ